jgi:3-oxoacyl-[acyl-carrier protein] reductase
MGTGSSRVAIVTGASRGIGRAIALRLAEDGLAVVVNYAGNEAAARETVEAIHATGGAAVASRGDVGKPEDVERLFAEAQSAFGRVDAVVNSAGVMSLSAIADGDLSVFDAAMNVNLRGTFLMMSRAAQALAEGGRFVALSSSVVAKNFPGYGAYIASKAGVEGLVRVFANELRGRGITVNAVAPGPVATELFLAGKSEALITQIANQAPLERLGQPEDIAGAVSFLVGADGGWINGQVLRANGGFV